MALGEGVRRCLGSILASRKAAATNAAKYAKEYADADKALVDAKRAAKKAGNFHVEAQAKIAFVIRTSSPPHCFIILSSLTLLPPCCSSLLSPPSPRPFSIVPAR